MTNPSQGPKTSTKVTECVGASVLRQLSDRELIELLDRLRLYSRRKYFGQLDSEELVMDSLQLVLADRRRWNKEYSPYENLCWIIRSVASNKIKKEARKQRVLQTCFADPTVQWICSSDRSLNVPVLNVPAEDEPANSRWKLLNRAIGEDGFLGQMIESARNAQNWKTKVIATDLGVDASKVHAGKKRLKRRLSATKVSH